MACWVLALPQATTRLFFFFFHPGYSGIAGVGQALLGDSLEQDSFGVSGLGEEGLLLRRKKSVILEALNYPCYLFTHP